MILIYFLSRQNYDDSFPHEIIPISFNMQGILQSRYYNFGEGKVGKYLVQTRSQAKFSGINLPGVHGVEKGLDPNIPTEKQVIKQDTRVKEASQIKPRCGQGRAGLKCKIKTLMPPQNNKPIVQLMELPAEKPNPNTQNF